MKVTLKQIKGLAFASVGNSGHWVIMDGPKKLGGFSAGTRPMELLLMGIAGCTGMDVVSILTKQRVNLTDFSMEVEAKEAEEYPRVFTEIKIHYYLTGPDIRSKDVERAIALSRDKYCSALAMLEKSVAITHDYRINEPHQEIDALAV